MEFFIWNDYRIFTANNKEYYLLGKWSSENVTKLWVSPVITNLTNYKSISIWKNTSQLYFIIELIYHRSTSTR